jgi:hypothetical protein
MISHFNYLNSAKSGPKMSFMAARMIFSLHPAAFHANAQMFTTMGSLLSGRLLS